MLINKDHEALPTSAGVGPVASAITNTLKEAQNQFNNSCSDTKLIEIIMTWVDTEEAVIVALYTSQDGHKDWIYGLGDNAKFTDKMQCTACASQFQHALDKFIIACKISATTLAPVFRLTVKRKNDGTYITRVMFKEMIL